MKPSGASRRATTRSPRTPAAEALRSKDFWLVVAVWTVAAGALWFVALKVVDVSLRTAFIGAASGLTAGGATGALSAFTAKRGLIIQQRDTERGLRRQAYLKFITAVRQYCQEWDKVRFDEDERRDAEDPLDREAASELSLVHRASAEMANARLDEAVLEVRTVGSQSARQECSRIKTDLPTDGGQPKSCDHNELLKNFERIKSDEVDADPL